jgi:NADH:ubiquinone oxidoreductase subunit 3 (subunit A)
MARRRRPSIPLIILFIILILLFLFAGTLVELMSKWTAHGSLTYKYTAGNEAIVSINYMLPQDLADSMIPEQTLGWTVTLTNDSLSLTDGTLNPGESVTVDYRLSKYIPGGTRTITATSTTESGTTLPPTESSLQVPEVFLLALAEMLHQNAIWLLVLAIIVLVIMIVLFIIGKKKDEEQKQKEETSSTSPQKPI